MEMFVVGYADFYNNDLVLTVEQADNYVEAIKNRLMRDVSSDGYTEEEYQAILNNQREYLADMPSQIDDIKQFFFDSDSLIDVIEIERQS
ncbi:hypothetical protein Lepto7375DRAFT_7249 [Leptolyngbya sp. PCC 7375]|nr:hypothetical protein Lepto7375DRAFT_7249 [Leptolyngbya sp. PCC 7375]